MVAAAIAAPRHQGSAPGVQECSRASVAGGTDSPPPLLSELAVAVLQKIHEHVANQRKDFQHQEACKLVQRYGVIAVEDLTVKGLAGGMLAKSVQDAGCGGFLQILAYKAESAGRKLFAVDPRGTSQTCVCGGKVPKRLADREHVCTACGWMASRDHVSAQVILQRARTVPSSANVGEVMPCVA